MPNNFEFPEVYHPNQVDLHLDEARQEALQSLGLADKVAEQGLDALTTEEAAQVGQALADRYEALASNITAQSE
ncbi:MAG TPA: hypothetical protein VFV52_13140 [Bacilli bacterium]|nr:hypothetical protein [Bacilli bacterium]